MTAEQLPNTEPITLDVEGLDEFFDTPASVSRDPGETVTQGISFKDACAHYGLKATALRTRIKAGEIAAEKVDGPNGPEWRVFPERVPQPFRNSSVTLSSPIREVSDNRLLDMIQELQNKLDIANRELQGANYRVGYLENQVLERERDVQELGTQIKLLTDSQNGHRKWWHRFMSWFREGIDGQKKA